MNKVGIYYAYWTHEWDADFHPFIDRVAGLGFDVLEINAGTVQAMSKGERLALRDHAGACGITLTTCIGMPHRFDLASPDASVRRAGVRYLQEMATAVGEIGSSILGGILYASWPGALPPGEDDRRPFVERSVASMREAVRAAEDAGVVLALEVVNRFEQYVMNTCAEALAYVEQVGSPNARILLDTFHLNIEEDFVGPAIVQAGDKLAHLHIGENNRMPPGYGHIPWMEIGASLRKIGYTGSVVMEPFVMPGGGVGRDIRLYRDLSAGMDMDREAQKALWFVRGVLK